MLVACSNKASEPERPITSVSTEPHDFSAQTTRESLRSKTLGTEHPILTLTAAPDGDWVVACQARNDTDGNGRISVQPTYVGYLGDKFELFLLSTSFPKGEAIQGFLTSDLQGRRVVFATEDHVVLRDWVSGEDWSLPVGAVGPVALDDAGKQLLYVVREDEKSWVVVRQIMERTEQRFSVGHKHVGFARFVGRGDWFQVKLADSPTSVRRSWGCPNKTNSIGPAAMQTRPESDFHHPGRWQTLSTKGVYEGRLVVAAGQDQILVENAGGLDWIHSDGSVTGAVPAGCGARLLGHYKHNLLVHCADEPESPLAFYKGGRRSTIPLGSEYAARLREPSTARRLSKEDLIQEVYGDPLLPTKYVDMLHGRFIATKGGSLITFGNVVVENFGKVDTPQIVDLASGSRMPLAERPDVQLLFWQRYRWFWGGRDVVAINTDRAMMLLPKGSRAFVSDGPLEWQPLP